MHSAVRRPDGHNVYLRQVLVMGTHNGLWLPVIREIRVTFDVQLAFSLPNVGEGSHLTKRFIAS